MNLKEIIQLIKALTQVARDTEDGATDRSLKAIITMLEAKESFEHCPNCSTNHEK